MSKRITVNVPVDITPYIPKTARQWELFTGDDKERDCVELPDGRNSTYGVQSRRMATKLLREIPKTFRRAAKALAEGDEEGWSQEWTKLHRETLGSELGVHLGGCDTEPNYHWRRMTDRLWDLAQPEPDSNDPARYPYEET